MQGSLLQLHCGAGTCLDLLYRVKGDLYPKTYSSETAKFITIVLTFKNILPFFVLLYQSELCTGLAAVKHLETYECHTPLR